MYSSLKQLNKIYAKKIGKSIYIPSNYHKLKIASTSPPKYQKFAMYPHVPKKDKNDPKKFSIRE